MIYSQVKRGVTPEINALSTLIVLASILGTIGVTWPAAGPSAGTRLAVMHTAMTRCQKTEIRLLVLLLLVSGRSRCERNRTN